MRIPLSWIREYTQFPHTGTAEELMADLVRVGLEEEDVHRPADQLSGPIVVGEVLSKVPEPQSNGKTINWCQVRVVPEGQAQPLQGEGISPDGVQGIVCGADNFDIGDKVVVTLPGAVLPGNFAISARKTYGHLSAGMIASVRELGIGEDHDGILVLSALGSDPQPGANALELLGLEDSAAEINVTPDRGYAFSIRGVAREYALATSTEFTDPASEVTLTEPLGSGHPVQIEDAAPIHQVPGCSVFVAQTVTGITALATTPAWMASRLRLAGMRPISLPVDISNYVMLELGQPVHCYDADTLRGEITVRRAAAGESLETLDGKNRSLHAQDLLIADDAGPLGIAGVMGGARSEVSASTSTIVVEAAHFEPVTVGRSKRRHKLPSEAAKRFERGVDPQLPRIAAQRVADLLVELAGATDPQQVTVLGEPGTTPDIALPLGLPERVTGVPYTPEQIIATLEAVGCTVQTAHQPPSTLTPGGVLQVRPPSWRPDMDIAETLVEEIARVIGYDQIGSRLPTPGAGPGLSDAQRRRRLISNTLAAAGFTEVLNYPFYSREVNAIFGWGDPQQPMVTLVNPVASQYPALRLSLLPGLLDALRRNTSRGFTDLRLFELGQVFIPVQTPALQELPRLGAYPGDSTISALEAALPEQPRRVGAVFSGRAPAETLGQLGRAYDWADALNAARRIAASCSVNLEIRQGSHPSYHPGRTAALFVAGQFAGYAGELHPEIIADQEIAERSCALELDVDILLAGAPALVQAESLSSYPPTTQDISVILDAEIPAAQVHQSLVDAVGELAEQVELFDNYTGHSVPAGKKSLAFAIRFRAADRTLTVEEASAARERGIDLLQQRYGAQLRS